MRYKMMEANNISNLFLSGIEWVSYFKESLGLNKKNHSYKILATSTQGLTKYVKYMYLDREYIVINRNPEIPVEEMFPLYPPIQESLDANVPVIVMDADGNDITDNVIMFAGPKGDFYAGTPYYIRLENISSNPITITDSNCDEHEFRYPNQIVRLID